jgi:hypothetical protein
MPAEPRPPRAEVVAKQPFEPKPARNYSWPDAAPGNLLALKHGAFSSRLIGERAGTVLAEIVQRAPHVAERPEFATAIEILARAVARSELIHEHIERAGIAKCSYRLLETASTTDNVASKLAGQLGLDPRSFVEIRALGSITDLNLAMFAKLAPEVPHAIETALARLGLGDRSDEFTEALRESEAER